MPRRRATIDPEFYMEAVLSAPFWGPEQAELMQAEAPTFFEQHRAEYERWLDADEPSDWRIYATSTPTRW